MGRIPKPSIAVLTNACNTYIKWAEIWERMYHIPVFTLDIPGTRAAGTQTWAGDPDFENDRRYVQAQITELIALCECVTGMKFDIDRLREVMGYANEMSRGWKQVLEFNKSRPSCSTRSPTGPSTWASPNGFRGTPEGGLYFQKPGRGDGLQGRPRHRHAHRREVPAHLHRCSLLSDLSEVQRTVHRVGRNFRPLHLSMVCLWRCQSVVSSTTWRGHWKAWPKAFSSASATRWTACFTRTAQSSKWSTPFHLDGVVYHPIKSCRTTSTGMADNRRALMAARDIPSLFIESDMMDRRVVAEAQMKNRIDAFFEGLASRRQQQESAAR